MTAPVEHTIGEHRYVIGRLNVRQQAEVATRLGFMTLALERDLAEDHVEGARFIGSIVTGDWGSLPQADRDTIMNTCFSVVRVYRGEPERLHPAFNMQTGQPQFEDVGIDLGVMFELVDLVIQENLAPFFAKFRADRERRTTDLLNQSAPPDTGP
jgi:hypothetical protein